MIGGVLIGLMVGVIFVAVIVAIAARAIYGRVVSGPRRWPAQP